LSGRRGKYDIYSSTSTGKPVFRYGKEKALNTILSTKDAYNLMLKEYPDVLDINQMSAALGVSTKTGYQLLRNGEITCLKVGRSYRIPKAHLLTYLKIGSEVRQAM